MANPEYAASGASVPVSTAAAKAATAAVRIGSASTTTAKIAAANKANRCHAGTAIPVGTGQNQIPTATARVNARTRTFRLTRTDPFLAWCGYSPKSGTRGKPDPERFRPAARQIAGQSEK